MVNRLAFVLVLVFFLVSGRPVSADVVTVLFSGFNPDNPGGMDFLKQDLDTRFAADFPNLDFSSQVFAYNRRQEAFDYINSFAELDRLFVVGHSWGGNALIRLARQQLLPAGIPVDATFQVDSVDIPDFGPGDNVLPANVISGYNYYQIATGLFEPQGEQNVQGAVNINVEVLFNDTTITHTSIDNDTRLYDVIYGNMRLAIPEPGALVFLVGGLGLVAGLSRRRTVV